MFISCDNLCTIGGDKACATGGEALPPLPPLAGDESPDTSAEPEAEAEPDNDDTGGPRFKFVNPSRLFRSGSSSDFRLRFGLMDLMPDGDVVPAVVGRLLGDRAADAELAVCSAAAA